MNNFFFLFPNVLFNSNSVLIQKASKSIFFFSPLSARPSYWFLAWLNVLMNCSWGMKRNKAGNKWCNCTEIDRAVLWLYYSGECYLACWLTALGNNLNSISERLLFPRVSWESVVIIQFVTRLECHSFIWSSGGMLLGARGQSMFLWRCWSRICLFVCSLEWVGLLEWVYAASPMRFGGQDVSIFEKVPSPS